MAARRPPSGHAAWCSSVLETLTRKSKRGQKLPTPRYIKEAKKVGLGIFAEENKEDLEDEDEEVDVIDAKTRRAEMQQEHLLKLESETRSFLPDVNQVLENLRENEGGLSKDELEKVTATFNRLKDSGIVDKEQLPRAISFLGYRGDNEQCQRIADSLTDLNGLEKQDFQKFVLEYKTLERARYKTVFDQFDADSSGELDTDELVSFLRSLGFTPLRNMINEALALTDLDGSGTLDFEECVILLHIYKHSEGFTMNEVKEFTSVFAGFDPENTDEEVLVDEDQVGKLLVKFFGPSVNSIARELQAEAEQMPSGGDDDENDQKKITKKGMNFQEALFWARRVRDKKFEQYYAKFQKFDEDGNNSIDMDELKRLLSACGFTLPRRTLQELLEKAQDDGHIRAGDDDDDEEDIVESMDYDTFVHFMQLLDQTDGFTDDELAQIDIAFDKFDADGSGDIDAVELNDVLQYMGFSPTLQQVRRLVAQVDFDGSGELDRREFVHLMRLHREHQLAIVRNVFDLHAQDGKLPSSNLEHALLALAGVDGEGEQAGESANARIDLQSFLRSDDLDIEQFTDLADEVVQARALQLRRTAGYSEVEVDRYKQVFDSFDTSRTGTLKNEDFTRLLTYLGFEFTSLQAQQELKDNLQQARSAAQHDGLEGAHSPGVNLWIMLKLIRLATRKRSLEEENAIKQAGVETGFTLPELNEFQSVFDKCWDDNLEYEEDGASDPSRKTIPLAAFIRLLRTMGIKMDTMRRGDLNTKVLEVADKSERTDFLGFLRVMRWMMNENFCNINGLAQAQVE